MLTRSSFTRQVSCTLAILLAVTSTCSATLVQASSPLRIGEVAWAGSSRSLADEWIELWNLSDTPFPLQGYSLVGASDKPLYLSDAAVIPPRGTFLISNYPLHDPKTIFDTPPDMVTSSVSLSNNALRIELHDARGEIVDSVGDGGAPVAGTTSPLKATMIRQGEIWQTATSTRGIIAGVTDLGTPGYCDDCVEPTSTNSSALEIVIPENTDTTSTSDQPAEATNTHPLSEEPSDPTSIIEIATSTITDATSSPTTTEILPNDIAILGDTTSTTNILIAEASSTDETAIETTSTEPEQNTPDASVITTVSTDEITPEITAPLIVQNTGQPPYHLLRLNEFSPYPSAGKEWVEITVLPPAIPIPLAGISLSDKTGKIFTFTTGTLDAQTPFITTELATSRLNNDGDIISLYDPAHILLDSIEYGAAKKNTTYIRSPDAEGLWQWSNHPTPGETNITSQPVISTPSPPSTSTSPTIPTTVTTSATIALPITAPISEESSAPTLSTHPAAAQKPHAGSKSKQSPSLPSVAPSFTTSTSLAADTRSSLPKPTTTSKTQRSSTSTHSTQAQTSTKNTKTTSKKATKRVPPPRPLQFSMTTDPDYAGIRVVLTGVVNSPPGLLRSHGFVLTAPDGRGLLVRAPSARRLPKIGTHLEVTGTLTFTDTDIPELRVGTADGWRTIEAPAPIPVTRSNPIFTAGAEDAWSFVSITGTVQSAKQNTLLLTLEDETLAVTIRPLLGYRVGRLQSGDTVHITGILDLSSTDPHLLPRRNEDIEIIAHAPPPKSTNASTPISSWIPFGAAGLAIAGTEGLKRLRERGKQKLLAHPLTESTRSIHPET